MAQTHANDLPEGFRTQAEVDNADARIEAGEFEDRAAALAHIETERDAKAGLTDQEAAGASFPPAGAAPSVGEASSMGEPPVEATPEQRGEPAVEAVEAVEVSEPVAEEPVVESEPEKKGRRG